jgi:hypothetical protein
MENYTIQMESIEYKWKIIQYKWKIIQYKWKVYHTNGKLYNTNGKLYNTNGKDQILQRLTCHNIRWIHTSLPGCKLATCGSESLSTWPLGKLKSTAFDEDGILAILSSVTLSLKTAVRYNYLMLIYRINVEYWSYADGEMQTLVIKECQRWNFWIEFQQILICVSLITCILLVSSWPMNLKLHPRPMVTWRSRIEYFLGTSL